MNRPPRRYWRSRNYYWYWLAILALLAVQWYFKPPGAAEPESMPEGVYQVLRDVDGDTLLLESRARVRLIGVNTPETVKENTPVQPWGPEASQFTKDFIADAGGRVRLTFDSERVDDYGRYLAYVWNGDRLLNEELLRAGLGRAEFQYHYSTTMKNRFGKAQREAQRAERGIWSKEPAHADERS